MEREKLSIIVIFLGLVGFVTLLFFAPTYYVIEQSNQDTITFVKKKFCISVSTHTLSKHDKVYKVVVSPADGRTVKTYDISFNQACTPENIVDKQVGDEVSPNFNEVTVNTEPITKSGYYRYDTKAKKFFYDIVNEGSFDTKKAFPISKFNSYVEMHTGEGKDRKKNYIYIICYVQKDNTLKCYQESKVLTIEDPIDGPKITPLIS